MAASSELSYELLFDETEGAAKKFPKSFLHGKTLPAARPSARAIPAAHWREITKLFDEG
jgi:hypothetical protein